MAKRRSIAELRRSLKRRLLHADQREIEKTARDLRSFALASAFFDGYSTEGIALHNDLAQALDRGRIETIIRSQSTRRR